MSKAKELSRSESQAVAQLESIREMIAALECDYDRLEELRDERDYYECENPSACDETVSGTAESIAAWAKENPDDAEELKELEAAAGECESSDDAEQRIQEDPLSIEVRSDWYTLDADDDAKKPAEFCILLCTGGPACRIVGDLDNGEPTRARLEHQDWGTSWQEHITTGSDHEALLAYARCFYYGE